MVSCGGGEAERRGHGGQQGAADVGEARAADAGGAGGGDADGAAVLPVEPGPEHRGDRADRVLLRVPVRPRGRRGRAPRRAGPRAGALPPARRPPGRQCGDEAHRGVHGRGRPVRGGRRRLRPGRRRRPLHPGPGRAGPARLLRPRRQEHPGDAAHHGAGDQVQVWRLQPRPGHEPLHVRRPGRHGVRQLLGRDGARRHGAHRATIPGPHLAPRARPSGHILPAPRVRRDRRRLRNGSALRRAGAHVPLLLLRPGQAGARPRPRSRRRRPRALHHLRGALGPRLARAHRRAGARARAADEAALRRRRAPPLRASAPQGILRERHRPHERAGVGRGPAGGARVARRGDGAGGRADGDGRVHAVGGGLLRGDARQALAGVDATHHDLVEAGVPWRRLRLGGACHVRARHAAGEGGHTVPRARQGEEEHQRPARPAGFCHGRFQRAHGRDMIRNICQNQGYRFLFLFYE